MNTDLFVEDPTGWYYTGPLGPAMALALNDRFIDVTTDQDTFRVTFSDDPEDLEGSVAEWGSADSEERAWRYALGAYLGPPDEEYIGDTELLRRMTDAQELVELGDIRRELDEGDANEGTEFAERHPLLKAVPDQPSSDESELAFTYETVELTIQGGGGQPPRLLLHIGPVAVGIETPEQAARLAEMLADGVTALTIAQTAVSLGLNPAAMLGLMGAASEVSHDE